MSTKITTHTAIIVCIAAATASFLLFMTALCMVLQPQLFDHPHWGLSYFGAQKATMLPYYGGFAIVFASLAYITRLVWPLRGEWRPIRTIFWVATALSLGVAATSYMQGAFLYWSHIAISLVLALWTLGAEVWILRRPGSNWIDYGAFVLLLAGALIINLAGSWAGVVEGLYWGEVVLFLGAFACLGRGALRAVASQNTNQ